MDEKELREKLEQDIMVLATAYSAERVKIVTYNFDRDYRRNDDGSFTLVSEKAIIRVLGKTTKVAIGENETCKTYEEAFEATKKYWSEYYKKVRAQRSEKERVMEAKRQKRYREKRKARVIELKQRR